MGTFDRQFLQSSTLRSLLMAQGLAGVLAEPVKADTGSQKKPQPQTTQIIDPDKTVTLPDIGWAKGERLTAERRAMAEKCLQPNETPDSETEFSLQDIYQAMAVSSVGAGINKEFDAYQRTMCHDETRRVGMAAGYNVSSRISLLPPAGTGDYDMNAVVELAAQENRHGYQAGHPELQPNTMATARDAIAVTYMLEADAAAHQMAVSWQRQQAGVASAWNPDRNDGMFRTVALAFEASMEKSVAANGPEAANSKVAIRRAMGAAFKAWFQDDNTRDMYAAYAVENLRGTQKANEKELNKGGSIAGTAQTIPRPERVIELIGHVAGDKDSAPYITVSDVKLAIDHASCKLPLIEPPKGLSLTQRRSDLRDVTFSKESDDWQPPMRVAPTL